MPRMSSRVAVAAFEMLEPCAVKVARTVLRGVRGRQRPRAYSTAARRDATEQRAETC